MLTVEKLGGIQHVVTHKNCPDGIASALLAQFAFRPRILRYSFIQYSTDEHVGLEPEPGMLFADFSPHQDRVGEFVKAGAIVLDHHKTAKEVVSQFGELGVFADEELEPGVSGAVLVYREVCQRVGANYKVLEDLATLVGIRDTWQTKHPNWRKACEVACALNFWPWAELDGGSLSEWSDKLAVGRVLLDKKLETASKVGDQAYQFTTQRGTRVAVIEGVTLTSDTAEYLKDSVDLLVGFNYTVKNNAVPSMIFSLRSHTGYDCGKMARSHGGGGHTSAAGFDLPVETNSPQPFEFVCKAVEAYESK